MREKIYINNDWMFSNSFDEKMLEANYEERFMKKVRLPHTNKEIEYNCGDEENYQEVCGYRKKLTLKKEWEEKRIDIIFEGAAHKATLYVNGKEAAVHNCGYTAFKADITDYLVYDKENIIAVKLDSRESLNIPPFGKVIDYMTYGGIYRDVYLEIHDKNYIKDIFLMQKEISIKSSNLNVKYELEGDIKDAELRLSIEPLKNESWKKACEMNTLAPRINTTKFKAEAAEGEKLINFENIYLWEIDRPVLYDIKVELVKDGKVLDENVTRIGFRSAKFKADGFYLNGRKLKIRGLDRHQCYPYVGYAMPKSMQALDADILKNELALNAVRTSHYPQSHYFLDRCDEIGLLVFTEMPGWQHIGDEEWKKQAVKNVEEMVVQYRNHPSIILWGVRINESVDDDDFYKLTNETAHKFDPSRQTGGVRNFAKSHLYEDVYTYNDFVHNGKNQGVDSKKKITSDMNKGYLVSEYNGHMFPTKSFDCEEHRTEHALRHARVIDAVAGNDDISGSFGWCMYDYNTHKDFGSGDRICYHGVMDMFRNPKIASAVYESQKNPEDGVVLEISSSMDIGEHPACYLGSVYAFTNADSVKLYKNDAFIAEFDSKNSPFKNLSHGPILIDDFIGSQLIENEGFDEKKAKLVKRLLIDAAKYGLGSLPFSTKLIAARLMAFHKMKYEDGVSLYGKYIGNWGGFVTTYRFDAISNGEVKASVTKCPSSKLHLDIQCDHTELIEGITYDVASMRLKAKDENGNIQSFYQEPIVIITEGPIELIGPSVISLKGGMGGTYLKTTGEAGKAKVTLWGSQIGKSEIEITVRKDEAI